MTEATPERRQSDQVVKAFDEKLDLLILALDAHRNQVRKVWRWLVGAILLAAGSIMGAMVALLIGLYAVGVANDIIQVRTGSRESACIYGNINLAEDAELQVLHDQAFADELVPQPRTPEQDAAVKAALIRLADSARIQARLRMLDCRADAIEQRYRNPPPDPATTPTSTTKENK